MKPVRLKPNSTAFADEPIRPAASTRTQCCEMPGCEAHGEYRAPKDRSLNEYLWFCRDHIASYNTAWNFFSGMNPGDVENFVVESLHGLRPTRPFSDWSKTYEELEDEIRNFRWGRGGSTHKSSNKQQRGKNPPSPQRDALKVLGLDETLDFTAIKTRYKELAKQLHPDLNPGNHEAEERLKHVNMAYTILRVAFAKAEE